ncbi:MAG: VCBS repeat-containing protein, partial [Bacteroidota bacterium]
MKNSPFPFLISIGLLVLIGCQSPSSDGVASPLMEVLSPERTGILFENRLPESPSQNVLSYEYYYNGAGLAIADFNQDGTADIYFVSNLKENQLYLNEGGMQFREVGKMAGLSGKRGFSTGVSTVDINSDGLMDIYVCKSGRYTNPDARRNELFINQGPNEQGIPVFVESARNYGLDLSAYSTQASFFDYDKDGDLDMFLINHDIDTYAQDSIARRKGESSSNVGDRLFQNQDGRFVDVSTDAGLINNRLGFGLGVGVGDFNKDTWPDVYVSTDYSGSDHLYINQRDGTFKEQIRELTPHTSFYSMGNDVGDINNDGWMDIINLDMVAEDNYGIKTSMSAMNPAQFENIVDLGLHHQYMYNTMLLNQGNAGADGLPYFSDIGQLAGISST